MKKLNIKVGISDFAEIRDSGCYYIDKSGLISDLLQNNTAKVTLITRPRRFGKTLAMSMLSDFLDIRKQSKEHFKGLKIEKEEQICQQWMNQCPTIFFSMKDVDGLDFESAYQRLQALIANLCKEHTYLLESDEIDPDDKEIFLHLKAGNGNQSETTLAFATLMRMMHKYYKRKVIFLLDEYDVPIAKASDHGYYDQMLDIVKGMMSSSLKDNTDLNIAVITGCLKVAKESIFTGTNNFVSDTISSTRLNEYFGFTQREVDQILEDIGASAYAQEVKEWYDGYHFGLVDVYCPWDVMNYALNYCQEGKKEPVSYWKNTSGNEIIRSFIDYAGSNITRKLETLLAGNSIEQKIEENLTYDYLHSSEENLWSILYLTGYLTKAQEESQNSLEKERTALIIPNLEVKEIYQNTILKWFDDSVKGWERKKLFQAVWDGNEELLSAEMTKLLRKTISYHDYKEDFYHAFLLGIFAGAGYSVESNKEHGEGRSDVVVHDVEQGRVAVFEVKYAKTLNDMSSQCAKALKQIQDKMYAKDYEDEYEEIDCYGISFYKKRCMIKRL